MSTRRNYRARYLSHWVNDEGNTVPMDVNDVVALTASEYEANKNKFEPLDSEGRPTQESRVAHRDEPDENAEAHAQEAEDNKNADPAGHLNALERQTGEEIEGNRRTARVRGRRPPTA